MRFEHGFLTLIKAYRSAMAWESDRAERPRVHLRHQLRRERDASEFVEDPLPYQGAPPTEEEELLLVQWDAEDAMWALNQAFLIALFHFWERCTIAWCGISRYEHGQVMAWLRENGGDPDPDALRRLELACHCAKHGAGPSANKLYAIAPDHFSEADEIDSQSLRIGKTRMEAYFAAVFRAAPRVPEIDR